MAKTLISDPIWGPRNFFSWVLPLLVVKQCPKLSSYAISRKTNEPNLRKWRKTYFGPDIVPFGPNLGPKFIFFFKNLSSSITRYHGQLSSCTISEKTNDPILRKLSDGWTDGRMDRRTRVIS